MSRKRYETLSQLIADDLRLDVLCACGHRGVLCPVALRDAGRPGHLRRLAPLLWCVACGGREISLSQTMERAVPVVRDARELRRLRARRRG